MEAGEDARTRNLVVTEACKTRLKRAERKWTQAQKKFETSFGAGQAAELRETYGRPVTSTV